MVPSMVKQRQARTASALPFDQHGASEGANDARLHLRSAVREPWDYVPVPPFSVDGGAYLNRLRASPAVAAAHRREGTPP